MTAEEMEVTYCKARITCMKSFRLLIREHIKLSEEGVKLNLTYEQVHKLMIAGLEEVDDELTTEIEKWSKMISARNGAVDDGCCSGMADTHEDAL